MEAAAEDDERLATGRLARDLDRCLDRLRTGVAEEHHVQAARRDGRERFRERDIRLVRGNAGTDVRELRGLGLNRGDDARVRVADRRDRDAAGEVEDPTAVAGDQPAPLPAVDLEPGVVAEDRRKDPGGALLERAGGVRP